MPHAVWASGKYDHQTTPWFIAHADWRIVLMLDVPRNLKRKNALLAVLFAAGLLNAQFPGIAQDKPPTVETVIEGIANFHEATNEYRAYNLLLLANCLLNGDSQSHVVDLFSGVATQTNLKTIELRWQRRFDSWVKSSSLKRSTYNGSSRSSMTLDVSNSNSRERSLAIAALHEASGLLDDATDKYTKVCLYLMVSRLYEELGDKKLSTLYCTKIEDFVKQCEIATVIDISAVHTSATVLNLMALEIVPLEIEDRKPLKPVKVDQFSAADVTAADKLKLRAAALLDRLAESDNARRKMHRDLALWYEYFGKTEESERQKQVLFKLVGVKDPRILYPTDGMCGHLSWWVIRQDVVVERCGMG